MLSQVTWQELRWACVIISDVAGSEVGLCYHK